ncbi:Undecaprenyl-diphosphatase [Thermosyntropha lipolytica DSM 11003]|uniref:Undecaprenyl-diphosphatase n=1 Tax=Thermosyntropha lipolytica DSM 11003 TaxID=1123382 RepID=A0A1M5RFL7_9FIRM|nr:undecaprenyl-diphosphatase UppP [Thermosyntropha lipolytica]SHH24988.1 Undecaprenyl-diphosphatase [Thermosyntropha lipolytica DSM 11003]
MTSFEAFILGMVQGLTEFLPISSSGHLVLFQHLFGLKDVPLAFDVLLHIGTLIAVFIAFWEDIVSILKKPFDKLTFLILVGIIPAGLAGYFLEDYVAMAFESLLVVGIGLIFTGAILKISENYANNRILIKQAEETSFKDAFFIGIMQALAILPGVSRSGSTIAAGLFAGLDRDFAARFSFLLSIPVILGAGLLQLKDLPFKGETIDLIPYGVGFLSSIIFGYLAIKVVLRLVRGGRLSVFSYYCWGVALLSLILYFAG